MTRIVVCTGLEEKDFSVAKRNSPETMPRPIRHVLRRLIKAPALLSLLWPAMLLTFGYFAWHHWGGDHVAAKFTRIDPTAISVSPQPGYIPDDVCKTVYQQAAVDRISLLDTAATTKIASAFSSHPWVRDVVSVRKLPGGQIDVHVNYRKPVAMVCVNSQMREGQWGLGYLPIDIHAVVLPTEGFYSAVNHYIKIRVPNANFNGNVGDTFDNEGVIAAAAVAGLINEIRDDAPVKSITVFGDPRGRGTTQLELVTEDGTRIAWGSPPGHEQPGEQPAALKLEALLRSTAPGTDLRYAARSSARAL